MITQGGSPPPKLHSAKNLFVDDPRQHVPCYNQHASDDLALRTGRRKDGLVSSVKAQQIPIHPNPFAPLQEHKATYNDFIPESDPEDNPDPLAIREFAPPKTATTKPKGKRLRSLKEEDITEEERDLSMYRLSDDDSDSSLTIYYKAYNSNKPEINESNAESVLRTLSIEKEIKRLKEARRQNHKRKKPKPANVPHPHDKGDDSDEDHDTDMTSSPPVCRIQG